MVLMQVLSNNNKKINLIKNKVHININLVTHILIILKKILSKVVIHRFSKI